VCNVQPAIVPLQSNLKQKTMPVKFSVVPRKNPSKSSEAAMSYIQAKLRCDTSFDKLCKDADSGCTTTKAYVTTALNGCLTIMAQPLSDGDIVRLG